MTGPVKSPCSPVWFRGTPAVLLAVLLWPVASRAGVTNSWKVFQPASSASLSQGTNKVRNANLETSGTVAQPLQAWQPYVDGYTASTASPHGGIRSLQCTATAAGQSHGASQNLSLAQSRPKAILLSGWSRAADITGTPDADFSVYLDLVYTDGTPLYGQAIDFSVGTHDWEYRERIILPAKPVSQVSCYVLFRGGHQGSAWFDDITVTEIQDALVEFDGGLVAESPPSPSPFDPSVRLPLLSGDGLGLSLSQDGGVITSLNDGTNTLHATGAEFASGWFVCDRRGHSDGWSVGGQVVAAGDGLHQSGVLSNLGLSADIWYLPTNRAIRMVATLSNLVEGDRALSVYFALPVAMTAGWWWSSPRDRVALDQSVESATLSDVAWGARNLVSQYPLATVSGAEGALTLSLPPDRYRPCRFIHNRVTRQFYAVFDVGISPTTANFPQSVTLELWLQRSDPAWGLRSGLAGYHALFPQSFRRNFTNEGIWVAFADIRNIPNLQDFSVAYHEIGYDPAVVKADDALSIPSFRYSSEPWSYWMTMPTNIPNTSYAPVYNFLSAQSTQGKPMATATLNSGVRDPAGNLEFFKAAEPWCPYGAAFYLNPSPFITNPAYAVSKFSSEWNDTARAVYQHPEKGVLDGEYIDSFSSYGAVADYATNHHRHTTFPLTYTREDARLMTPLLFGSLEMSRAIGADVHTLGKPFIGNSVFVWPYLPVGIGLFDFGGSEVNWFDATGGFVPPSDSALLYARSLSAQRPYGYLLNTDFTKLTHASMETYMRMCAFYAIYPSAFSVDASNGNYFQQPTLYERDRSLFKKYVPIVRALSVAGWSPVTGARGSESRVGLERYGGGGAGGAGFLTLRNLDSVARTTTVTLERGVWGPGWIGNGHDHQSLRWGHSKSGSGGWGGVRGACAQGLRMPRLRGPARTGSGAPDPGGGGRVRASTLRVHLRIQRHPAVPGGDRAGGPAVALDAGPDQPGRNRRIGRLCRRRARRP